MTCKHSTGTASAAGTATAYAIFLNGKLHEVHNDIEFAQEVYGHLRFMTLETNVFHKHETPSTLDFKELKGPALPSEKVVLVQATAEEHVSKSVKVAHLGMTRC